MSLEYYFDDYQDSTQDHSAMQGKMDVIQSILTALSG